MAEHFKYFPSDEEVVTPWNARYSYPSQANKATKMTPRIPPKNGSSFQPGQIIRLEFPAQGYVNPLNTTLEMDVVLIAPTNASAYAIRFQNNIQSIFNRVRLLYGASPQEDILQYNILVRALTEWTSTNQMGQVNQTSIADGIGGFTNGGFQYIASVGPTVLSLAAGIVHTRQKYIQGLQGNYGATAGTIIANSAPNDTQPSTLPSGVTTANAYSVRRYQINFALGIFTQDKLIPTKYMASQLAIEITLEQANACIYQPIGFSTNTSPPTYAVGNINLIPEIIEFDDSYDVAFLNGLESGGVPIKFATWHYFQFTTQGASSLQLQITERSRSVKGIFAVQRRNPQSFNTDSHALLFDSNPSTSITTAGSTCQQYQYRIGGRYFPAAPVQLSANVGNAITNGGAEAYIELEKFLNIVGDYRLSPNTSVLNWAIPSIIYSGTTLFSEYDYSLLCFGYNAFGIPNVVYAENTQIVVGDVFGGNNTGNMPSSMFCAAINFETSNGVEISGLNAEEQSDISFNVMWSANQSTGFSIECFTYVDVMWVLRPNNYLDLIQ
jgi:hypothetical protein